MTVCIAAIAENGKKLALASDSRVSFGTTSADNATNKNIPIWRSYVAMIAGNDIAHADSVLTRASARASSNETEDTRLSAELIAESVFLECQAERDRLVEASVLRRRGFDWASYRERGREICTEAVYYDLQSEISNVSLSLDVLLAGFDSSGVAQIRFTNWNTPPQNFNLLGFWAIGSGASAALGSYLHAVEHLYSNRFASVDFVFYHVMAAKFMAEAAQDVGRETFAVILEAGQKSRHVPASMHDMLRKRWENEGAPRTPSGIEAQIAENIGYVRNGKIVPRKKSPRSPRKPVGKRDP